MKKIVFISSLFICLFSLNVLRGERSPSYPNVQTLSYAVEDSVFSRITEKSKFALNRLIERNNAFMTLGQTDSLRFILNLNFDLTDGSDVPYFNQTPVGDGGNFVSTAKATELNTSLTAIFQREGIAPYLLFINYFNYKLSLKISETETIQGILDYDKAVKAGKRDEEIENRKNLHARLTEALRNSLPTAQSWTLLDVGRYINQGNGSYQNAYLGAIVSNKVEPKLAQSYEKMVATQLTGSLRNTITEDEIAGNYVAVIDKSFKQATFKLRLFTILSPVELYTLLTNNGFTLSNQDIALEYTSSAYRALSIEERMHCLKVFLNYTASFGNPNGPQQILILALLKNTPKEDVPILLQQLKDKSSVPPNEPVLLYKIMNTANNGIFGIGDKYTDAVKILSSLCALNPDFAAKATELSKDAVKKAAKTMLFGVGAQNNFIGGMKFTESNINPDGSIFTKRLAIKSFSEKLASLAQDFAIYETTPDYDFANPINLTIVDPYELVVFTNYSDVSVVNQAAAYVAKGEELYVPALFLPYAKGKQIRQEVETGVVMAIDVATFFTGAGELALAWEATSWGRRTWTAFNMANAVVNVGINTNGMANDPRYAEFLKAYNTITLIIGGIDIVRTGVVSLKRFDEGLGRVNGKLVANDFENSINSFLDESKVVLARTDLSAEHRVAIQKLRDKAISCTGYACFVAGTLVATNEGLKPIESIAKGDSVWSWDIMKEHRVLNIVNNTFGKNSKKLINIFAGKDKITATPEHPFYVNNTWQPAGELQKGMKVFLSSGVLLTIDSLFIEDTIARVFNFDVANTHNYFVGTEGVLVHNTCHPSVFVEKLRKEGLTTLITKFESLADDATRTRFLDDFADLADTKTWKALNTRGGDLVEAWIVLDGLGINHKLLKNFSKFGEEPDNILDFLECYLLLKNNNLFRNMGSTNSAHMTVINRYTRNGDYILNPMRGTPPYPEIVKLPFGMITFEQYEYYSYQLLIDALRKLRTTNRLMRDVNVFRGRKFTLSQYKELFTPLVPSEIPLRGFQSCSKTTATPLEFFGLSPIGGTPITDISKLENIISDFDGFIRNNPLLDLEQNSVNILFEIKSKNGIDIDDISDWGTNLGPSRHAGRNPATMIQQEVLLEEGKFLRVGNPIVEINGSKIYIRIRLEELGIPLSGR